MRDGFNRVNRGFTIVELLIVITVVGVLAGITIVAYNTVQNRAKDAAVRIGVGQFEKALVLWNTQAGISPRGGWGSTVAVSGGNCTDGSGGWTFSGAYTCTIEDILASADMLETGFTRKLPNNSVFSPTTTDGRYTLMFYPCGSTGRFALYYHLRNPTAQDTADVSAAEASGCPSGPRVNYAMNGVTVLQL